jgi:hypothetical protein
MSILKEVRSITAVRPFAPGKNVRINIEGLAVCEFETDTNRPALIRFLQHINLHQLRFSIVRMAPDNTVSIVKDITLIETNKRTITINGSNPVKPTSHVHPPYNEECELEKLLNLSELHRTQFNPKTKGLPDITTMTLRNCAFYASKVTERIHRVKLNGVTLKTDNLCEVLSGYMVCNGGTINVDIPGVYSANLPIVENEVAYKYEIAFTNHCEAPTSECRRALGSGSDVRFLYNILDPQAPPIVLEGLKRDSKGKLRATPNVAACLPGGTKPCTTC